MVNPWRTRAGAQQGRDTLGFFAPTKEGTSIDTATKTLADYRQKVMDPLTKLASISPTESAKLGLEVASVCWQAMKTVISGPSATVQQSAERQPEVREEAKADEEKHRSLTM
ncbi:hypothetical protein [Legionella oakridgensis]|uniref:hypothetical protein n=1 Tax=Legionella oakridgensis TaxID=29423 RepID=UPI0003DE3DE6|nr:hypothetical protein [Legionella oakridgensis]ETO92542.1 hypothetical protein LOR_63c16280 [Legionella oakridgensis RV-2-2007]